MKKNKGITLIALVITIIVLLILAGVTINTLFGQNGIMQKANKAKIENEKKEIEEVLKLAVTDIKMKVNSPENGKEKRDFRSYFTTLENFKTETNWKRDLYIIDDEDYEYLDSSNEVKLAIYKKDGVGQKFKFKVDLSSGNVTYDGNEETKNEEKEKVIDLDNKEESANIEENVDPEFYACDNNGNKINGFENWFDKNINTYVDRNTRDTLKIKWNGDITGKQIYVRTTGGYAGDFFLKYINDAGEVLNTYTNFYTETSALNWNSGDSITYVPEGATALLVQDWEAPNICEVELFENGNNNTDYISNVKIKGLTSNKVELKWNQNAKVKEVKIYKDGTYIGTSTNSEYLIQTGLMNNKTYIFYLEPVTDETTEIYKNKKVKLSIKTLKDTAGFYIENVSEIRSKFYDNWFDGNLNTYLDINSRDTIKVKWTENISGKIMCVNTTGGYAGDFFVKYIDADGNILNSNTPSGAAIGYLNYNSGSSVSYIPEGATRSINTRLGITANL